MSVTTDLIASSIGGAVGIIVGQPLDFMKTRAMVHSKKSLRSIVQTEGWLAPFKGSLIPMVGSGLYSTVAFTVYCALRKREIDIFTAGCIGGVASVFVTTPSEMMKIGLQMDTGFVKKGNLREFVKKTYRTNGLKGFYLGFWPTLIRDTPATGIYFYSYAKSHEILHGNGVYNRRIAEVISGGSAGVLSWVFVIPIDVIKTRVQYDGGTTMQSARSIYSQSGVRGFFRGAFPCIIRAFPVNAVTFLGYEETLRFMNV